MAPKIVLITGCLSGIGLATAVLLAKQKQHEFKVYATVMSLEKSGNLENAAGENLNKTLFIRELDVTNEATISKVVDEILQENGGIDVLVNNAGRFGTDVVDERSLDWCQRIMDVNYWGTVRTTRCVLPAMKKQKSGRILNVSSAAAVIAGPFFATYSASKYAVEGFSESMAPVLRDGFNIRVSMVEPGPVQTGMLAMTTETPDEKAKIYDDVLGDLYINYISSLVLATAEMTQSPDEIAELILEIILSENPHLRYQTGKMVAGMASFKWTEVTTDPLLEGLKH